jgi:iron complex transport system substrate-binding protein
LKIVSLLPSATEIVYALGLEDQLEGVTFECNFPAAARDKPIISGTALTGDDLATPAAIDDAVSARIGEGEPIYTLDRARIAEIQPDLILAQDLCEVCAVPSGAVADALDVIGCRADVISLDPATLDDVIACVGAVGGATGRAREADALMASLRDRVARVRDAVGGRERRRVFALEWLDPPFNGGHWMPDMIDAAGGEPVLTERGKPSVRVDWADIVAARPDVIVVMPCGYGLPDATAQARTLLERDDLAGVGVIAVDGDALFSRPGPRVVDGIEALAAALHPDVLGAAPVDAVTVLR